MSRFKKVITAASMFACASAANAQTENVWNFDSGFAAGSMPATSGPGHMEFWDVLASGYVQSETKFNTTTSFGIPDIAGQPANAMFIPWFFASEDGYMVFHEAPGNGGGVYVNQYTLAYDMLVPGDTYLNGLSDWIPFYNTNGTNTNDGDAFIWLAASGPGVGGIGISGVYDGTVLPDTWYRVVLAVDLAAAGGPVMSKYIDGVLVAHQILGSGVDGRWAIYSPTDPDPEDHFFLASDDNGDANEWYLSSFAFADRYLSESDVIAMGAATASGIEFPSACPCDCNFDTSTGQSVCDIFDFLAFQNGFVGTDPCACDRNVSTGVGICDIFDFLDFQNGFVTGCP